MVVLTAKKSFALALLNTELDTLLDAADLQQH